jgi:tetratricopeptide (TPR) repeat protein
MLATFGFFGTIFDVITGKLSYQVIGYAIIAAITILVLCGLILINKTAPTNAKKRLSPARAENLPALTDNRRGSAAGGTQPGSPPAASSSQAFAKDLVARAQAKGVPVAPLQSLLESLIQARIYEEAIPDRLVAAADQLAELRAKLAHCQPRLEEACSKALACIDRGDLDAAIEALRLGREAGWAGLTDTYRQEAELYAKEAQIDHLRVRFCDAATKYASATALILESEEGDAWPFLIGQARELCDDGREFGNYESLLLAADVCHRALGIVPREQRPCEWAATKHCLGQALFMLGARHNEPDRLGEAIEAYFAALEEWTHDRAPEDWAKAQNDLGDALQVLGNQNGDPKPLREAAQAYRAALTQWRAEAAPFGWANTYKSLGDALSVLGIGEDQAEHLIEAIDAYREALQATSRELAPAEWALIQNNLGKALQTLGENENGGGRLHQAVAAYQAAMQDNVLGPSGIASASNDLGNVLVTLGERENSTGKLKDAASAFRAALEAEPEEAAPLDRARVHINLAYTLGALWNRTRNPKSLNEALGAVNTALSLIKEAGASEQMPEAEIARETILAAMGAGNQRMAAA